MEEIPKTESVSLERALPLDEALLDICENADTLKQPLIIKEVWAICVVEASPTGSFKFTAEYEILNQFLEIGGGDLMEDNSPAEGIKMLVNDNPSKFSSVAQQRECAALFASWLKGVRWNACTISYQNRPSSASWKGFPWQFDLVTTRLLKRSSTIDSVEYTTKNPNEHSPSETPFVKLWSKGEKLHGEGSTVLSTIVTTRKAAMEAVKQSMKKRDEELKKEVGSYGKDHSRITKEEISALAESRNAYRLLYQIKASVKDTDTWRMPVVSGTVTFDNLHKILQIVFQWDGEESAYSMGPPKRLRTGLSSSKTKWIDMVKFPGDSIEYHYNKWLITLVVDVVAYDRIDAVPRCVDGDGEPLPEDGDSKSLKESKKTKRTKFDLDKINKNLMGKRFAANSAANKRAKTGPAFWVGPGTTKSELNAMLLKAYRRKL